MTPVQIRRPAAVLPGPRHEPERTAGQGAVDVLLADGQVATIRPVTPADHDDMVALHAGLSDDSIRMRFFGVSRDTARKYAERLTSPDNDSVSSLAATLGDAMLGVASAEHLDPTTAEMSFLVADRAQGLGIGTLLLEHLAADARNHGITSFTAEVLFDNTAMLRLFTDAGFDVQHRSAQGVVTLRLSTAASLRAVAAADRRECAAESRSLAPLFAPASVAVVGVRRDGTGIGRAVLADVRDGGFTGDLCVVHPGGVVIDDVATYPSFAAIGHRVDVALIAVPAEHVPDAVTEAAEAGVAVAVVLSAGFGELGADGTRLQDEMVAAARRHSMRIIGPNCLGVIANGKDVSLNATFTRGLPPSGGLAIGSQSGGVGIALLDVARDSGLGIASFVSLGNKADVSGNDLLAAWMYDDRVTAAALYLESFGNAQKFARLARTFSERKPLLAVVGGRSSGGRRAGASHTAAAATPAVGIDALFAQAGVIGCRSIMTLAETARLLTTQALPAGARLGIVGNAGGLGVLAADAATADGLLVPELSAEVQAQMGRHVSGTLGLSNPVDLGAGASAGSFVAAVATMLGSDEVDAVLAVVAATAVTDAAPLLDALVRARDLGAAKPLMLVALGDLEVPDGHPHAFARFKSVEDATEALAHAVRYAAWLEAPRGLARLEDRTVTAQARRTAAAAVASTSTSTAGWLSYDDARELLGHYGVDAPTGVLTTGRKEATAAAQTLGFPVVAKVADPTVVHRTERRLVRAGLTSAVAVQRAVADFRREIGGKVPVLIQPQVSGGVELAVGVVRDRRFGPLVMVAAGGVATDVWSDQVFLMPPITDVDAARALRSLRIWPLLAGHRGSPRVDIEAVELLILSVAQLALDVPDLAELDLNPVIVTADGVACVDAKVRVQLSEDVLDGGIPRRLPVRRTP